VTPQAFSAEALKARDLRSASNLDFQRYDSRVVNTSEGETSERSQN
jgi:hypothetical protein